MRPNLYLHLHPPTIHAALASWRYKLGACGTAVFPVLLLVITGALDMFFFILTPAVAALLVQTFSYLVPFLRWDQGIQRALLLLSSDTPAPIAPAITEIANPASEARAFWLFLFVRQMLDWGDPFSWGVLAPLLILSVIVLVPYILQKPAANELGRWFPKSNRLAQLVLAFIALLVILFMFLALAPVA